MEETYAEGQIKDHHVRVEVAVIVAEVTDREIRVGDTPARIRGDARRTAEHELQRFLCLGTVRAADVCRHGGIVPPPEPNLDPFVARARHDVVAAAEGVEDGAVRCAHRRSSSTALVEVCGGVAVGGHGRSRLCALLGHHATWCSVEGGQVRRLEVHSWSVV